MGFLSNIGPISESSRPNKELKDFSDPWSMVATTC